MVSIFYGEKGSGKTKRMVEHANAFANMPLESRYSNGYAVYLDSDYHRMYELVRDVKLISLDDFDVCESESIIAFIKGLVAGNGDIRRIYIDSIAKILNSNPCELEEFFKEAGDLAERYSVEVYVAIDRKREDLPEFMLKYTD